MAPLLMVSMGVTSASAAPAPTDDESVAALKAEIRQLYAGAPGTLGRTHKMQAFIMELALRAKAQNPDFQVIPQDAAQLAFIDGDVTKGVLPGLFSLVDGWGKEDALLGGDGITPTTSQRPYVELARLGLPVTETSTVTSATQLQDYYRRATNFGIIPYPRVGGTLAQQLYPGKRWATNGDYFWVENPTTIGLGDRVDGTRDVNGMSDAKNYLYNINSRPYDDWPNWDAEEAAALADGEADRTRITDSYGNGLLVPSPGGPYHPAGNATTVANAIAQYGNEWDWWWRAAGLDENAGRETWLNALRNSDYDVIYIDSFYNHRALPNVQTPLTRAEVESLKHKPDGSRRQVIAYLSVGSAEQNRWYAQDDWTWVDPANPNSERSMRSGKIISGVYAPPENAPAWLALGYGGNYAEEAVVQWWNRDWRDIIINGDGPVANVATGDKTSSIDRIVAQGFDGAYLDNVGIYNRTSGGGGWNAFESYWQTHGGVPGQVGPSTVQATPSSSTIKVDRGSSDIAVTVSAADARDATGTVTASVDGTELDSATLVAGAATLTVGPFATVGDKTVTIDYAGHDMLAANSTTTTITVEPAIPTSTTATAAPMTWGKDGTVNVTVSPSSASGPVTVSEGATDVGFGTVTNGSGTVTIDGKALEPGTHTLTVWFARSATHYSSQGTVTVTVAKAATTLSATTPATEYGAPAAVSVTTSPDTAEGPVTVSEGGTVLGEGTLEHGADVVSIAGGLEPGSHTLTVRYAGDDHHAEATTTATLVVNKAASSTSATVSPGAVEVAGRRATVTVSVDAGDLEATGTAVALVDGVQVDSAPLSGGQATLRVGPFASAGTHTVEIRYSGDDRVAGSSTSAQVRVVKATSTVGVESTPKKVKAGKTAVKLTVKVRADGFTPGGFVSIRVAGQPTQRAKVNDRGNVTFTLEPFGTRGSKTVTVEYEGNNRTEGATVEHVVKVVKK